MFVFLWNFHFQHVMWKKANFGLFWPKYPKIGLFWPITCRKWKFPKKPPLLFRGYVVIIENWGVGGRAEILTGTFVCRYVYTFVVKFHFFAKFRYVSIMVVWNLVKILTKYPTYGTAYLKNRSMNFYEIWYEAGD